MEQENMENEKKNSRTGRGYQPRFAAPKPEKNGKTLRIIVICALAAALLIGGGILAAHWIRGSQPEEELTATTESVEPTETEPPETEPPETEPPVETTEPEPELPYAPDDALLEAIEYNSDIYGRLSYGDVEPQYVTHTYNNDYYLSHDAFGNWDREGAAFIDCRCTIDPRDTNLMIHGHNMNVYNSGTGKSFATLFKFKDESYLASYPIFTLETGADVQYYVPYALPTVETAYGMPGFFSIIEWNFANDDAFNNYVGYFRNNSLIRMPVKAEPGDQLLTLSTCINDGRSATELRLLVCLRRLREDETVEYMQQLFKLYLGHYRLKPSQQPWPAQTLK